MRIIIADTYEEMGKHAANIVAGQVFLKPESVLGLATGSTPLSMYMQLINLHKENSLDFSQVTTFNLDEYIGLKEDDLNSYNYYMHSNLFNQINVSRDKINIPRGTAEDWQGECEAYEERILSAGGIDIQVLGIGNNGHIGFNEPNLKFEASTHIVKLDDETIRANARFFEDIKMVPRHAISMGIKTIMQAKRIILLANGAGKAEIICRALYGPITPKVPASILQLHPDVVVVVDREAGKLLREGNYPSPRGDAEDIAG